MKRLSIFTTVACGICFSFSLRAEEKKMSVLDYYLLLPDKTFDAGT